MSGTFWFMLTWGAGMLLFGGVVYVFWVAPARAESDREARHWMARELVAELTRDYKCEVCGCTNLYMGHVDSCSRNGPTREKRQPVSNADELPATGGEGSALQQSSNERGDASDDEQDGGA